MYLAEADRAELTAYLAEGLKGPVEVHLFGHFQGHGPRPDGAEPTAEELELSAAAHEVLTEVTALSPHLSLHTRPATHPLNNDLGVVRWPALALTHGGHYHGQRFYGIPTGYEFAAFLDTLLDLGAGHVSLEPKTHAALDHLAAQGQRVHVQVFGTPNCPYCPVAAHQALQLAQACDAIEADSINALDFPELVERYSIRSVPHVVINERFHFVGAVDEAHFLLHVQQALAEHTDGHGGPEPEGPASRLRRSN